MSVISVMSCNAHCQCPDTQMQTGLSMFPHDANYSSGNLNGYKINGHISNSAPMLPVIPAQTLAWIELRWHQSEASVPAVALTWSMISVLHSSLGVAETDHEQKFPDFMPIFQKSCNKRSVFSFQFVMHLYITTPHVYFYIPTKYIYIYFKCHRYTITDYYCD